MSPCMSRLGEPGSPERELQVLGLFYAHKHCTRNPICSLNTPIQFDNLTLTEQQSINAIKTPTPNFPQLKLNILLLDMVVHKSYG